MLSVGDSVKKSSLLALASIRMVTSLLTDRRLRSCLSGAVLTTWSLTRSKPWRWSWTSGEPPCSPPHSPSWTALWLQWSHSDSWAPQLLRTWSGTITLSPLWKRPSRSCTSFTSWGSSTCHRSCWNSSTLHHWIHPQHINNGLVQLSYQIWPQMTTEGCPDCWENHCYNPPHSPRTVLIQSEQKGWKNHSGPHISTLTLWTVTVWSTLQNSEHQNHQTQKQFLSPSNTSHEHLTLNMEHTTLNTIIYSYTYFFFISNLHMSDLKHIIILLSVLSCCCHSVALWSFCHYNKFLVCVNIPGQ